MHIYILQHDVNINEFNVKQRLCARVWVDRVRVRVDRVRVNAYFIGLGLGLGLWEKIEEG